MDMTVVRFFILVCILTVYCFWVPRVEAAKGKLTIAEKYVLQQVARGEVADLNGRFGDKEKVHRLSARFLEDLLTGAYKVHRKGIRIAHAVIDDPLDLELSQIPYEVRLIYCRFKKDITFKDTIFEKNLVISVSHFDQGVNFQSVKVKNNLFCQGAVFNGSVNFDGADIIGQFESGMAKFENEHQDASFFRMTVGQDAVFQGAVFSGPVNFSAILVKGNFLINPFNNEAITVFKNSVDFRNSDIRGQFNGVGAKFESQDQEANFCNLKVGGDVSIDKTRFKGPVKFIKADIAGQLSAFESKFENKQHQAIFNGLKVGQQAIFDGAVFSSSVDFGSADIAGGVEAIGAIFESKDQRADSFHGLKVGKDALFSGVVFSGRVDFEAIQIKGCFSINTTVFNNSVDFSMADIAGGFSADGAYFKNKAFFFYSKVGKGTIFHNTIFKESVYLCFCTLQILDLRMVSWPPKQNMFNLEGTTYQQLKATKEVDGPQDWDQIFELANNSRFNIQNYEHLKSYMERYGHKTEADNIFIQGKRRELREQWNWLNPITWLSSSFTFIFWDLLTGYGRHPYRTLGVGLLIILIGAVVVFDPQNLKENKMRTGWQSNFIIKCLIRFIISLDHFLPGIDLKVVVKWHPSELPTWKWCWLQFEQISGWILIPIGLAAIYSQFK
jgi:uncharacterized protein YjbI with pentapeptide repeats